MYQKIFKIIEGGLEKDRNKVINYALALEKHMESIGENNFAKKINNLLSTKGIHPVYLDELIAVPLDKESKLSMIDINIPEGSEEINLIFNKLVEIKLNDFMEGLNYRDKMEEMGIGASSSLLLYGPPGCGKTSAANYISNKANLPLVTARLDTIISSLLGNTSKNIRKIFDYANSKPCILFLDEFDAIAKARDDQHELGELKRVVNSLLQNIDDFLAGGNILIAATNHDKLLDKAIWRRFNTVIEISKPDIIQIKELIFIYMRNSHYDFKEDEKKLTILANILAGYSPSDIKDICYKTIKRSVINNQFKILFNQFIYEVCLYKSTEKFSEDEMIKFLNDNGVTQSDIQKSLNISIRQVRAILNK